jgi:hypothetical protein
VHTGFFLTFSIGVLIYLHMFNVVNRTTKIFQIMEFFFLIIYLFIYTRPAHIPYTVLFVYFAVLVLLYLCLACQCYMCILLF